MRYTIGLLILALSGCQTAGLVTGQPADPSASIMTLWARYQQCQTASDSVELLQLVQQFDRPIASGSEPPAWLVRWGSHVAKQPLRLAVDPRALGASCTLRAAQVLSETDRVADAQALYEYLLANYSSPEWAYYRQEVREGLDRLSNVHRAVLSLRTTDSLPR